METAKLTNQQLLDSYYEQYNAHLETFDAEQRELAERRKKSEHELIMAIVARLEANIPESLKGQLYSYFSFTEEEVSNRISLYVLVKESTFKHRKMFPPMMILRGFKLDENEIKILNQAWYPIAIIGMTYRSFHMGNSEVLQNILKKDLEYLKEPK